MEAKIVIPVLVSALALGVAFVTLYFSQLRAAAITITAGEHVNIWYFTEGNCAATLPINVANNGARTAVVRRLALLIQEGGSTEGYLFEPVFYDRIDEDGNFQHESQPHPIAVPGRSTETKQILFRSSLERPEEFRFRKAGSYRLTVVAWLKNSVKPQAADTFSLLITDTDLETLEKYRAENQATSVRLQQSDWRKWGAHKLTEVETAALGVNPV
jgi:hypothetical protein